MHGSRSSPKEILFPAHNAGFSHTGAAPLHERVQDACFTMREVKLVLDWYVQAKEMGWNARRKRQGARYSDNVSEKKWEHTSDTSLRFRVQDTEHKPHGLVHSQGKGLFRRRRAGCQIYQPAHLRIQENSRFLRRTRGGDVCDWSRRISH